MKEDKKIPKLRFPDFTDDWEQRKYSDIAITRRGLTYKPENIVDGGKRVLRSSNINEDTFETHDDDVFVDAEAVNIPYVKNGDILITSANGSSRLVGKHAIIRNIPDNSVVHGGFMLLASSEEPEFVNALMSSQWYTKFINVYVAGGNGAIGNLNKNDLDEQLVMVPSKPEREKIGAYFSNLDNLITLHQRKLVQMKEYKKGMLQKMFPKEGEKQPEIRFPGFSGDWERRKLGNDIESIQTGTNLLGSDSKIGTPLLKMGNIQRGYFDISKLEYLDESDTVEPENIAYYGDFFFNTRNTMELVGKGATWLGDSGKYAFNSNIARFKFKDIDTVFFNFLYNTEDVTKQIHARATGTTSVAAIYPRTLENVEYRVPSRDEQAKIGELFVKIDNLITLLQRKLEKMKEYKKGLLQQLFV